MLDAPNAAKFSIENLMKPSVAPKRFNPSPEPYHPYPGAGTRLYPIPAPVMSPAVGDHRTYQLRYGGMIAPVPVSQPSAHQPAEHEQNLKRKFHQEEPRYATESPPKRQQLQPDFRDQILREHREQLIRDDMAKIQQVSHQHQTWSQDSHGHNNDQNSQDYRDLSLSVSQHNEQPSQTYRDSPIDMIERRDGISHQRDTVSVNQVQEQRDQYGHSPFEYRERIPDACRDNLYQERTEQIPSGADVRPQEPRPISPAASETHSDGTGEDGTRRKKTRTSFSTEQIAELERRFRTQKYLAPSDRGDLAGNLGLSDQQVKTWFQNRRMKDKRSCRDSTEGPGMPPHTTAPYTTAVPTCLPSGFPINCTSSLPTGVPVSYPFTTASQIPFSSEHPRLSVPSMYPVNMTSQRLLTPPMGSPGQQSVGSPHPQTSGMQMLPHMIPPHTVSSPYMPRSPYPMMPL